MRGDYTKWPRLVIIPEPGHETVTRDQVSEILLRTNGPWLCTNDREWEHIVAGVLGMMREFRSHPEGEGGYWATPLREMQRWYESISGLQLRYIKNDRIMSTWVGGPHGWLNWDGRIGCNTWNIGKWPTEREVTADLAAIADAFPYLDFHAQVINDYDDDSSCVAAQWRVTSGRAVLVEPIEMLEIADPPITFLMPGGERGTTVERLTEAMTRVRELFPL